MNMKQGQDIKRVRKTAEEAKELAQQIANSEVEMFGIKGFPKGSELLDKEKLKKGYFSYLTGVWSTHPTTLSSDYIKVYKNGTYKKTVSGSTVFFDKNFSFISGQQVNAAPSEFTVTDPNIEYVVIAFNDTLKNSASVTYERGNIQKYTVDEEVLEISSVSGFSDELNLFEKSYTELKSKLANSKTFLRIPTPYDDGTDWEGRFNQTTHPSVLYFKDGWNGYKYWMAHTPYPFARAQWENPCIAASNNGVKWEVPAGLTNPLDVKPSDGYNSDTHLLYNETTLKLEMWYRAVTGNSTIETIWRRTSSDGVNWTPREQMITATSANVLKLISPSIVHENGKYRMWIVRDWYVYLLESVDGFTWVDIGHVKSDGKNLHSWHPFVIKHNGLYHMINCDKYETFGRGGVLKYSTSIDGINWDKERLLLSPSGNHWDLDGYGIYRSSLVFTDYNVQFHYSQYSHDGKWTVSLATGTDINALIGIDERVIKHYE